jgi:uncharacterized phiE125 gp8 family phage protein
MVTINGYASTRRRYYSGILSDPVFDETGAVEPVDLIVAKRHLNITFTDDDNLLNDIIKAARIKVEKRHNVSLVTREVTVTLSNGNGKVELPYGPVQTFDYMENIEEEEIVADDYTVRNLQYVESPISEYLKVTYTAGYSPTTIPADYKREILEEIAYLYRHRGDEKRENNSKIWIL